MAEAGRVPYGALNLMKPTKVLVDVPGIIFYNDVQVLQSLAATSELAGNAMYCNLFPKVREVAKLPYDELIDLTMQKQNQNILLDFLDYKIAAQCIKDGDFVGFCNRVYNYLLYDEEEMIGSFTPTGIGSAFRILAKEQNLTKLTLVLPVDSYAFKINLERLLSGFGKSIIDYVVGDLHQAIIESDADCYFLSDIQSIESIPDTGKEVEVYVPAFIYNFGMYIDGKDTEEDIIKYYAGRKINVDLIKPPF